MIVIKLGGSLLTSGKLMACLDKIEQAYQGRVVVIVPGGGVLADQVRKLQLEFNFDDCTAHQMALLTMQQMALLLGALKSDFTIVNHHRDFVNLGRQNRICIWSPDIDELDADAVPASWEVTSDSLAAWLATKLGAEELILVKSATIASSFDIKKLTELKIVDSAFYEFSKQSPYSISIIHADHFLG